MPIRVEDSAKIVKVVLRKLKKKEGEIPKKRMKKKPCRTKELGSKPKKAKPSLKEYILGKLSCLKKLFKLV